MSSSPLAKLVISYRIECQKLPLSLLTDLFNLLVLFQTGESSKVNGSYNHDELQPKFKNI